MRQIVGDLKQLAQSNHVLKEVPISEFGRLIEHMQIMEVDAKEILHQAGEPIRHIFSPITALLSMLMPTSDGSTVELATVGREGLTGTSMLLSGSGGDHMALARVITIVPGIVLRIESEIFKAAAESNLRVGRGLCRYWSLLFTELALSVTCNRLHSLERRCARWLLTGMDKSDTLEIPVTQEMLAGILGASRQSIAQIISYFEMRGMIRCGRGFIRLEMRKALMESACECYTLLRKKTFNDKG